MKRKIDPICQMILSLTLLLQKRPFIHIQQDTKTRGGMRNYAIKMGQVSGVKHTNSLTDLSH